MKTTNFEKIMTAVIIVLLTLGGALMVVSLGALQQLPGENISKDIGKFAADVQRGFLEASEGIEE